LKRKQIERILIIRPDKIGDLILTLPMATVIKESMPNAHVSFLVQDYTISLAALCPDIDNIVLYDRSWTLKQTIALIQAAKPDAIFVFGHKLKLTFASFLSRVPIRVGRAYFWFSFLYNHKVYEHRKKAERNEADYNTQMLSEIGIKADTTPFPNLDTSKLSFQNVPQMDYAVFHVTTGGSTLPWKEKNFVRLAAAVKDIYHYPIVLTGTIADNEFLLRISERMKLHGVLVHIHITNTLPELAALLVQAKFVISCGTGPGHLAAALGTATIGLFPNVVPLSKARWGFRGKKVINLSPLIMPKKECPQCKDCICINEVTVEQVTDAIETLGIS
jgi:heptosyltransferase-3